MSDNSELTGKNDYISIAGLIISTIALILSIVFFIIQQEKVQLSFSYSSNLLVTNGVSRIEGLDVKYKGNTIDQLSVTTCTIQNTGNTTIEESDVYNDHKLKIRSASDNFKLLFADVIHQSYDTNNCQVKIYDNCGNISFGTLEKKEKFIINIYHTGNENTAFFLDGRIEDGSIINAPQSPFKTIVLIVVALLSVSCIILILSRRYSKHYKSICRGIIAFLSLAFMTILYYLVLNV